MALTRTEIDRRMAACLEACRAHGVKITPQRMEVFREVARTDEHPDVEGIFTRVRARLPAVSMDTVYRTLCTLEELGLIRKVSELHGAARYDGNVARHHHFVCTRCGRVRDFYSDEFDRMSAPAALRRWGSITGVRAEVLGVCTRCRPRRRSTA